MSDVAVTWAKAQTCMSVLKGRKGADGVVGPDKVRADSNAKAVLVAMASYADAEGRAWVLVDVLAMEIDKQPRMVERGRQALVDAGLLIKTTETHLYGGRKIPIYRLPLELGHASTVRRRIAEREARIAKASGSTGVTGDTQSEGRPPSPVTPDPRHRCRLTGVTGDTLIGKGISQDQTQGVRACASDPDQVRSEAFEQACDAWAAKAPERVSPPLSWSAWVAALERAGLSEAVLLAAVLAAVARDPDFGRGRAINLDRWLTQDRFRGWLTVAGSTAGPVTPGRWDGPAEVRAAVVDAIGEAGAVSYLDTASWVEADRAVRCRTSIGAERLRSTAGRALSTLNVTLQGPAAQPSQHRNER